MITLNLTHEYTEAILQVLGQLPTQTNAYPIFQEVKRQYETQATSDTPETTTTRDLPKDTGRTESNKSKSGKSND